MGRAAHLFRRVAPTLRSQIDSLETVWPAPCNRRTNRHNLTGLPALCVGVPTEERHAGTISVGPSIFAAIPLVMFHVKHSEQGNSVGVLNWREFPSVKSWHMFAALFVAIQAQPCFT